FCYSSYYFAPVIIAGAIYLYGGSPDFRRLMLALSLANMVGYVGYVAVPAVGPYIYQPSPFHDRLPSATRGANYVVSIIDSAKGSARDCFPSMHTANTTIALLAAFSFRRFAGWLFLPIALGLYLSAIYLRMHYVVDVVAGFLLAVTVWALAP